MSKPKYTKQLKYDRKELRLLSFLLSYVDTRRMARDHNTVSENTLIRAKNILEALADEHSDDGRTGRLGELGNSWGLGALCCHVVEKDRTPRRRSAKPQEVKQETRLESDIDLVENHPAKLLGLI